MKKEIFPIVITGHIDHGKSSLIGRLLLETHSLPQDKILEIKKISRELGKDTELAFVVDQLKEERENNMTIDTTQIFFNTRKRSYCIIDTPGHVEFLKNMITGASHAEAAILIVDANEGIKEQTRRHLYIIQMLGIKQLIIVLNKMDLVDYSFERFHHIKEELFVFLEKIAMPSPIVIPISARANENISQKSPRTKWFRGPTLLEALDSLKTESEEAHMPLTLPVQDVYEVQGRTIAVAMVASGTLRQGARVVILPDATEATIETILSFGQNNKKEAKAQENVGIAFKESVAAKRGDIIVEKDSSLKPKISFKGDILWLSEEPLRLNKKVMLRCATQDVACFVEKIEKRVNTSTLEIIEENGTELKIHEAAQLTLKTERPVLIEHLSFIEKFGRFAIEENHVLRGLGIVV